MKFDSLHVLAEFVVRMELWKLAILLDELHRGFDFGGHDAAEIF